MGSFLFWSSPHLDSSISLSLWIYFFLHCSPRSGLCTTVSFSLVCIYVQLVYNFVYIISHHGTILYGCTDISLLVSHIYYTQILHILYFFRVCLPSFSLYIFLPFILLQHLWSFFLYSILYSASLCTLYFCSLLCGKIFGVLLDTLWFCTVDIYVVTTSCLFAFYRFVLSCLVLLYCAFYVHS